MKLRTIRESYEGLPDEDQFQEPGCGYCQEPLEVWLATCTRCMNEFHTNLCRTCARDYQQEAVCGDCWEQISAAMEPF
jgi:predicted amidophosphoribosyltransferase